MAVYGAFKTRKYGIRNKDEGSGKERESSENGKKFERKEKYQKYSIAKKIFVTNPRIYVNIS